VFLGVVLAAYFASKAQKKQSQYNLALLARKRLIHLNVMQGAFAVCPPAAMADRVDYKGTNPFIADNNEWLKDAVLLQSNGNTPDKGAIRRAFAMAGTEIY
jgi:hypothetical protein